MAWPLNRTVVEEQRFKEQLQALAISYRRLDDVLAGLYFALSQKPDEFYQIEGTQLRIARTATYPDAPALRIFFTFNSEDVRLLCIEFAEEDS